jgi:hypothetical protein
LLLVRSSRDLDPPGLGVLGNRDREGEDPLVLAVELRDHCKRVSARDRGR